MTTRVDIEEIEATKSEKFLAVVLAAFLLIGTIWFYAKTDDWTRQLIETPRPTVVQKAAFDRQKRADRNHLTAEESLSYAQEDLTLTREAYRTELDAGRPAAKQEAEYRTAQQKLAEAQGRQHSTRTEQVAAAKAAKPLYKAYGKRTHHTEVTQNWVAGVVRLAAILLWFGVSLRVVSHLRQKQSKFLPLGFAAAGAGVITALVFATDYITDYIDPLELGPIVLSAVGAAATIGAFVGLQRWLARRIPGRRVRNGECPFCGHPVRESPRLNGPHCEGCGRDVVAPCAQCGQERRVGSPHCPHCGVA